METVQELTSPYQLRRQLLELLPVDVLEAQGDFQLRIELGEGSQRQTYVVTVSAP
jgi:hypothetical protein